MKKLIISILTALSFILVLPIAAIAGDSITLNEISGKAPGDSVTIVGQTTLNEVNIKVVRPNNTVMYVNVANSSSGSYTNTFKLPSDAEFGTYTVVVGQGGEVDTGIFTVGEDGDDNSNSRPSGGGGSVTDDNSVSRSGGTVTEKRVSINIPSNAVSSSIKVKVVKVSRTASLPMSANSKLAGDVYEITKDKTGDFSKPVTITLPFDKSKVNLEEYDLGIFWLDESNGRWVELDNVEIDLSAGEVSGQVTHFTKFAVITTKKPVQAPAPTTGVVLKDITGHWAEDTIKEMVARGVTGGYPDGTFKPNNNITRAEFAVFLVRAFGLESDSGKVFADTANHWAKDDIATAAAHEVVGGYDANTFGPNDLITREQMASMIVRAAKLTPANEKTNFADSDNISGWAKGAVATATKHGIMNGYPDNTVKPKGNATRAEAVTVIYNAIK